jgi:hypothetical protein
MTSVHAVWSVLLQVVLLMDHARQVSCVCEANSNNPTPQLAMQHGSKRTATKMHRLCCTCAWQSCCLTRLSLRGLCVLQVLWTHITNRHTHGNPRLMRVQQGEGLIGCCAADKKQLALGLTVRSFVGSQAICRLWRCSAAMFCNPGNWFASSSPA